MLIYSAYPLARTPLCSVRPRFSNINRWLL